MGTQSPTIIVSGMGIPLSVRIDANCIMIQEYESYEVFGIV